MTTHFIMDATIDTLTCQVIRIHRTHQLSAWYPITRLKNSQILTERTITVYETILEGLTCIE